MSWANCIFEFFAKNVVVQSKCEKRSVVDDTSQYSKRQKQKAKMINKKKSKYYTSIWNMANQHVL